MPIDSNHFKQKLEEERQRLEEELGKLGRRNPSNPNDWEPGFEELNAQESSQDEMADKFEEMEQVLDTQSTFENRLKEVNAALERIEKGTYGTCSICGNPVPEERLEADPTSNCDQH